jgi:hypothetical protein
MMDNQVYVNLELPLATPARPDGGAPRADQRLPIAI